MNSDYLKKYHSYRRNRSSASSLFGRSSSAPEGGQNYPSPAHEDIYEDIKGEPFDYEAWDNLKDDQEPFSGRRGRVEGYAGRSKPSFSGTDYQGVTGRRGRTATSPAESKTNWSLLDEFAPSTSFDSSFPRKTAGKSYAGVAGGLGPRGAVKPGELERSLFEICRDLEIDVRL